MTKAEKMAEKLMNKVVETAFYKYSAGVVIPMMSIPVVFKRGEDAYKACAKLPLTAEETAEIVGGAVCDAVTSLVVAS